MNKLEKKNKKTTNEFPISNYSSSNKSIENSKTSSIRIASARSLHSHNSFNQQKKSCMPIELKSAKIYSDINLVTAIKSISKHKAGKEKENSYCPYQTENVDNIKYSARQAIHGRFFTANSDKVKISQKGFGIVKAYGAITNEGKRNYNEDRVSIIYKISKTNSFVETLSNPWPKCSFFGLYDGHGGSGCADYLRDNLHKFIISDSHFPLNPQKAIVNGFVKAEKDFIEKSESSYDPSGSCAIVLLIIEKRCYIANVGDSRALLSGSNGRKTYALSRDHRPGDEKEYQRILQAGGKIYQTEYENQNVASEHIVGPLRVIPGKLSVSRTIGDIEAKNQKYGGNPNVIISTPEIKYFDINDNSDYILIGCDGIYEKMKNKQIVDTVWSVINNSEREAIDIHNMAGMSLEKTVDECLKKDSTDNLTMIIICFKDMEKMKVEDGSYYVAQTENIDPLKQKGVSKFDKAKVAKSELPKGNNNAQRQPLSVLLTKLMQNNNSYQINNMKKMVSSQYPNNK